MVTVSELSEWVQEKVIVDGLVSIYKPYGIPSTAITELYKRATQMKVGHGGTLDPLAEGAMLLGIGKGTKLLTKYLESEKRYRAVILIGADSPSGDLELPINIASSLDCSLDRVTEIAVELSQEYTQELPALNAAKQKGKTAYSLIREGKPAEKRYIQTKLLDWKIYEKRIANSQEISEILVAKRNKLLQTYQDFEEIGQYVGYPAKKYRFMLEKWLASLEQSTHILENSKGAKFVLVDIEVYVPKGTYIRSLAMDIAKRMESVGMLLSLIRLNAGSS